MAVVPVKQAMFQLSGETDTIGDSTGQGLDVHQVLYLDADQIMGDHEIDDQKINEKLVGLTIGLLGDAIVLPYSALNRENPCWSNNDCSHNVS